MQYFFRFLLYLIRVLFVLLVVMLLVTGAFFMAMNTANNYVLTQEGFKARASAVLMPDEDDNLYAYFSGNFIENDDLLHSGLYAPYTINSFNQKVSVQSIWCWPWEDTATATVRDVITYIDGVMPTEHMTDAQRAANLKIRPPSWQNGVYEVTFRRIDGSWKIDSMHLIETVTPTPTPSPSA